MFSSFFIKKKIKEKSRKLKKDMNQTIKIEPDLEIIDDKSYLTILNTEYSNEKYTSVEIVSKIKFISNETKDIQPKIEERNIEFEVKEFNVKQEPFLQYDDNKNEQFEYKIIPKNVKKFICDICDQTFKRKLDIRLHMQQHARPFKCSICKHSFKRSDFLISHMFHHTGHPFIACTLCLTEFNDSHQLNIHMQQKHNVKRIICDICGRSFSKMTRLKSHLKIHIYGKRIECKFCTKEFGTTTALSKHLHKHTVEELICKICSKQFSDHKCFKRHKLIHTNCKPHECPFCFKTFRLRHHLNYHTRSLHTGERPYSCNLCQRTFPTTWAVTEHKRNNHKK